MEKVGHIGTRVLLSWIMLTFPVFYAATTTSNPTTQPTGAASTTTVASSDLGDIPKAVITIAVLAVILGIAIIVAKLATMCYERGEIRDDASDISEHTRDLLKAKLTVAKFKSMLSKSKKAVDREKMRQDASRRYAKIWIANMRKKRKLRAEAVALKWTTQTKEHSRASLVPPIDAKPVDGNTNNGGSGHQTEVKVINETDKPKSKGKGGDGKTFTKFPTVLQKQPAIPAPHPDDPKSDILDTPKKTANSDSKQKPADDNKKAGGGAPANTKPSAEKTTPNTTKTTGPAAAQREQSMGPVTPKNVAVEVDNKPITAKSQAMRPVSAKPKLIRPSSAEKKPTARPGTAKRPPTAKRQPEPSAATNRPGAATNRPTTAAKRAAAAPRPTTAKKRDPPK